MSSFEKGDPVLYIPNAPNCSKVVGTVKGQDRDGKVRVASPEWGHPQRIRPQNLLSL